MSLNRLVGKAVVLGVLVACGACLALASEPGSEERLGEIRLEEPENYGPLPNLLEGESLPPEPLPQGVDSWESSSNLPPAGMDAATLREWRQYQREQHQYELEVRRQEHREQMDRDRMEMQRERDQQRYQYQQMRTSSRGQYGQQYGQTGTGYAGNNYYPSYTPQAPLYTQQAPMYVPVAPAYNPYISVGLGYGGCDHGSCDYRSSRRRTYGYGSYYGERRGRDRHCH